ncbi:MAG TPA: DUF3800 domain-containing protein [Candidatus Binataceae bacterium]|nr:DUF3800 domain-containing protein [Candidatus Binataceae bacterium]
MVLQISEANEMAMLTVYCDEAGTDEKKPAVAVGCYLSTQERWHLFNPAWARLGTEEGVAYYHRTDQESFFGPFVGWTKARKISSYRSQHEIIKHYTQHGIGAAVIKADYDETIVGKQREILGNYYEWCLRHCLAAINSWADKIGYNEDITYLFESGADGQGHFDSVMKMFYDVPTWRSIYRIGRWAFADKKKTLPLQAADAFAYELAKEMENALERYSKALPIEPRRRSVRKSAEDLIRETDDIQYWNRPRLQAVRTAVEREERAVLEAFSRGESMETVIQRLAARQYYAPEHQD